MCDKTDQHLLEDAEMLQGIRDYDAAQQAIADGENPIRVWREYRGMTQAHLAKVAEISVPYLSQLESGKRKGSTDAAPFLHDLTAPTPPSTLPPPASPNVESHAHLP